MRQTQIKLGSTLKFDSLREKDIIELIEKLKGKHKLGEFINDLIRYAYENPDKFTSTPIDTGGISERRRFFSEINAQVVEMKDKIDAIHKSVVALCATKDIWNSVGLEQKIEANLLASLVVKLELERLEKSIGLESCLKSYKLDNETYIDKVNTLAYEASEKVKEDMPEIIQALIHYVESNKIVINGGGSIHDVRTEYKYTSEIIDAPEKVQTPLSKPVIAQKEVERGTGIGGISFGDREAGSMNQEDSIIDSDDALRKFCGLTS